MCLVVPEQKFPRPASQKGPALRNSLSSLPRGMSVQTHHSAKHYSSQPEVEESSRRGRRYGGGDFWTLQFSCIAARAPDEERWGIETSW